VPLSARAPVPRPSGNFTPLPTQLPPPPEPVPAPVEPAPAPIAPPAYDAAEADNLQRLAALAMAQLGDNDEEQPAEEAPASAVASQPMPTVPEDSISTVPPVSPVFSAATAPSSATALNLNTCSVADLLLIPGCTALLAEAIVHHRGKIGSFRNLEQLFDVPGMNRAAYTTLTGETAPDANFAQSLNELLGFPPGQTVSLKDVTDRIACWPDVTGCVLSQSSGLSLVGTVPDGLDKSAIVAFAPRMFEAINKSLVEITGKPSDELIIPVPGMSFHILRHKDLYLIILCRLPQMPERHMKVARYVLAGLSLRPQ
jgi:DNA uptake protein ComE-like DNA-binding protein